MNQVTYCVLYHMGDWQIFSNGVHYGPHRNADAAIKIAVAAAKRAKKDGDAALVILQNRDGNIQTIWQYGCQYAGSYAY
jgi:hypothetical protein